MSGETTKLLMRRAVQLFFVIGVTALAWFNVSAAVIAICAVIIVAFSGKLESLVELSFGPLKAKIERNLSESEELLEKLRGFSAVQARAAISASVNTGRFASGNDWIFQSVKRVEAGLREIGISEGEIIEARQDFVELTVKDTARAALGGGRIPMHIEDGKKAEQEWRDVRKYSIDDPDAIQACLEKWGELTPERVLRIEDMRWMLENKDVRDSDQYMRAHQAVEWQRS